MKGYYYLSLGLFIALVLGCNMKIMSQSLNNNEPNFWDNVRFGGSLGLGFGDGYFNGTITPSAVYDFNRYVSVGTAVNFSYVYERDFFESYVVGISLFGLFNPIPEIQLSVEPQQSFVTRNFDPRTEFADENYWVSALFLGAGFNTGNVTIGIQYDVLHDPGRSIFIDAWYPFVRVFL
ncbi:MAG: alpha-ketoglutarate decarboxylase [Bacteroidota bacterium]